MPTKFRIARGKDANIQNLGKESGRVYFATDTGKIYYDVDARNRITMGGSGVSIHYGQASASLTPEPDYLDGTYYVLTIEDDLVDPDEIIAIDDLIFNSDGTFYKVVDLNKTTLWCTKVAVAGGSGGGSGSGSSGVAKVINLRLQTPDNISLINNQAASITLVATSAIEEDGSVMDEKLTIVWSLESADGSVYHTGDPKIVNHNVPYTLSFGEHLRTSATSILKVQAKGTNSGESRIREQTFSTSELTLTKASTFSNLTTYTPNNVIVQCNVIGNMNKVLDYYLDGELVETKYLTPSANTNQNYQMPPEKCKHGYHTIRVELYQGIETDPGSGEFERALAAPAIELEIAVVEAGSDKLPIIWLGDYQKEYFNYDDIRIPYLVYDPSNTQTTIVYLWKNGLPTASPTREVKSSQYDAFNVFEITDADEDVVNYYAISCGVGENETRRDITFQVTQDPNRSMTLAKPDYLKLSFDAKGRSNNESVANRKNWPQKENIADILGDKKASFENFNWYNNGWSTDDDGITCLTISNGASLKIPVGTTTLAGTSSDEQSWTYEFQFKVRNVQDYTELIQNITRYKGDDNYYKEFIKPEQTKYTNYDSFLHDYLPTLKGEQAKEYDDLEFNYVYKKINLSKVSCKYVSGSETNAIGFCLGAQDAFFSNGTNTVNVSYVEGEMVYLSIVYDHKAKRIYAYINGVLTSAINSTISPFKINSDNIIFESSYCDFDLYKMRIYNTALNVYDIVMNYAVDTKNVTEYDLCGIATEDKSIDEYCVQFGTETEPGIIKYNKDHPSKVTMPYIVFDTTNSNNNDRLSWRKSVDVKIGVVFKNVPLDAAYAAGELEELAIADGLCKSTDSAEKKKEAVRKYYLHHCPSWTGDNINMAVQGTSSEFYPRRNYKIKTKTDWAGKKDIDGNSESTINMYLNDGPYYDDFVKYGKNETYTDATGASKTNPCYTEWFYMNNYDVGTTKFTMKVDFMESSGSYNAGLASLTKLAYSKHPLSDYNSAFAFEKATIVNATGAFDSKNTYYSDNKGENEVELTADTYVAGQYYTDGYTPTTIDNVDSLRTATQGFPVMAFHKKSDGTYQYIGLYRMLLDKGSDEIYGFKCNKKILNSFLKHKGAAKKAECWEFSDNSRTFCSYRDPLNRKELSFLVPADITTNQGSDKSPVYASYQLNSTKSAPIVCDSFEYRYHADGDCLDYFYDPSKNSDKKAKTKITYAFEEVKDELTPETFNADSETKYYYMKNNNIDANNNYQLTNATLLDKTSDYYNEDRTFYTQKAGVDIDNLEQRKKWVLDDYKNWEAAVKWVWSTCTDVVPSQGTAVPVNLGDTAWAKSTFFCFDDATRKYTRESATVESFNPLAIYYTMNSITLVAQAEEDSDDIEYVPGAYARKTDDNEYYIDDSLTMTAGVTYYNPIRKNVSNLVYQANKYYINRNGNYVLCSDATFDSSINYYKIEVDEDALATTADRLVKQCTADDVFSADQKYYTYDPSAVVNSAVTLVNITEEEFNADKTKYYYGITVTYGNNNHTYDTKEYRNDKFVNELSQHFDIEYLATYFVLTEVFECYDSRGKNCMMASWGPRANGGEYIWYPIFYDLDTQLGINNTGIPSFTYSVDATEDGNYSTSDSVLWNNFYQNFKNSYILQKYKQLKGDSNIDAELGGALTNLFLDNVDTIEKWYQFDSKACGWSSIENQNKKVENITMRGQRPLIATNLDEYYKYIFIYNTKGLSSGKTGRITDSGEYKQETTDYLYALQGNRSLSRRQFLKNRIEYIDSWLNVGNYQRGGYNRLWGRVAANNSNIVDQWYGDYWKDTARTIKNHEFDAEYWVTLTPIHDSYVTLGGDNEVYPSKKFSGTPLRFEVDAIKEGFMNSNNYKEQLLYIYGINQMKDLGDLSKNYWTEFKIEGDASKLTRLKLGHDAYMTVPENNTDLVLGEDGKPIRWYNNRMNPPSMPSKLGSTGMPLLKEVNMSNITINETSGSAEMDLTSCQKLENFRATNSNFTEVKFAKGVALNTLYLPSTITNLELVEARLLNNIIEEYEVPTKDANGDLVAKKGMYIQNLTDVDLDNIGSITSPIQTLSITGDNFGYDSYKLLKKYYTIRKKDTGVTSNIKITGVNWSPYVQLVEGDEYIAADANYYYEDNGHYGFKQYQYDVTTFGTQVENGEIYKLDKTFNADTYLIKDANMILSMIDDAHFVGVSERTSVPELSGIMYVDNDEVVDELDIRSKLNTAYPKLTVFFKNVTKAYSAKFILPDLTNDNPPKYLGTYQYVTDGRTDELSIQKIALGDWFSNPYTTYKPENQKPNYDFIGWSTSTSEADIVTTEDWNTLSLDPEKFDYTFYALFTKTKYLIEFFSNGVKVDEMQITYGEHLVESTVMPVLISSNQAYNLTYRFLGYTQNENQVIVTNERDAKIVNFEQMLSVQNYKFYAAYIEEDVHLHATPDKYFKFSTDPVTYNDEYDNVTYRITGYEIGAASNAYLSGKITLPTMHNNLPVIGIMQNGFKYTGGGQDAAGNALPDSNHITHIFWQGDDTSKVRRVNNNGFSGCQYLEYYEFTPGLRVIGNNAFSGCNSLRLDTEKLYQTKICTLGPSAFNSAFKSTEDIILKFPGTLHTIGSYGFANNDNMFFGDNAINGISEIHFGGSGDATNISAIGDNTGPGMRQNGDVTKATKLVFYTSDGNNASIETLLASKHGSYASIDPKAYNAHEVVKA